jgi:hypothetical protein
MALYLFCARCDSTREVKDVLRNSISVQGICKKCKFKISYDEATTDCNYNTQTGNNIKAKIFISYARSDSDYAIRFCNDLKQLNYDPWMDKDKILPGQVWAAEIEKAVKGCNFFIPLLSHNSTKKDRYVKTELKQAVDIWKKTKLKNVFVIPVRINNCDIPKDLKEIQYEDMFPDWKNGIDRIHTSLQQHVF